MRHARQILRHNGSEPQSNARKPKSKEQELGQVFTTDAIAFRMAKAIGLSSAKRGVKVIDPCVGEGVFVSAIDSALDKKAQITAFDVDENMCSKTRHLSKKLKLAHTIVHKTDFLNTDVSERFDYALINPPYVRQEWIKAKTQYRNKIENELSVSIPGTSNLYVYFIVKTISLLRDGGKMACIVYDSWQSTLYGRWLKSYLDDVCVEWRSEAVPNSPFEGHMIDATIIYLEKGKPKRKSRPSVSREQYLRGEGFSEANELFETKRGLRLKQSNFFLTTAQNIEKERATHFVKKVAKVSGYSISADHSEAALLYGCGQGSQVTKRILDSRLQVALQDPESNVSILNWYNQRPDNWWRHTKAPQAPLLFNYYMRHRPKHILNSEEFAYSDNFYGCTPKDNLPLQAWLAAMNSTASAIGLLSAARNQGSGLAKLQLYEYRSASLLDIRKWSSDDIEKMKAFGEALILKPETSDNIIKSIDNYVSTVLRRPELEHARIESLYKFVDRETKQPKRHALC